MTEKLDPFSLATIGKRMENVGNRANLADLTYPDQVAMSASHQLTDFLGRIYSRQLTFWDKAALVLDRVDYKFMSRYQDNPSPEGEKKQLKEEQKVIKLISRRTKVSPDRIDRATEFWLSATSS